MLNRGIKKRFQINYSSVDQNTFFYILVSN